MQTIREAKIVIHLEQGKVELKAPDLSGYLKQQQQQIDLTKQLDAQLKQLQATQAATSRGGGGGSGGGGGAWSGTFHPEAEARSRERSLKLMQEEERALARLRSSLVSAAEATRGLAEGTFRVARGLALLGASDESLQKMIRSLAQVQAYWDIISGSIQIVSSLIALQKSLAAAQASYTLALNGSTLATQAFTVATVEAGAALTALAARIAAVVAVAVIVTTVVMGIWDALTESEEEAKQAADEYARAVREGTQSAIDAIEGRMRREEDLNSLLRDRMSLQERQDSLARARSQSGAYAESLAGRVDGLDPNAQRPVLDSARDAAIQAIRFANEELAAATRKRDAEIEITQEKIKQIEAQERAVDTARKQQQIEEDKLRSFQAQVGALQQFEQEQLKQIRDKLRAGQDINQFEEDFFAQNAGGQGRAVIDARRAKRGAAAGFGDDFFAGIDGAGTGLADATKRLEEELRKLAEALEGAKDATEAKARYEQRIKEINEGFESFLQSNTAIVDKYAKLVEVLEKKIADLEQAAITG